MQLVVKFRAGVQRCERNTNWLCTSRPWRWRLWRSQGFRSLRSSRKLNPLNKLRRHFLSGPTLRKKETVASAFLRGIGFQEYQVRSAAEAMPEEKYSYRPAEGKFKNEKPQFGPAEVRTFAEQVKHVACANFAFAAELDGQKPPDGCDKGGPDPAKTRKELLTYLRDSFAAIRKSLSAMDAKNMFDPIEGPYAGPNTRLGIATVIVWHNADHYGQMTLYLRQNGIVPPASRANPPKLNESY